MSYCNPQMFVIFCFIFVVIFLFCFHCCWFVFKTEAQAAWDGFDFTTYWGLTLNFWSSCLYFLSDRNSVYSFWLFQIKLTWTQWSTWPWGCDGASYAYMCRSGIAGSSDRINSYFLINCHNDFHSGNSTNNEKCFPLSTSSPVCFVTWIFDLYHFNCFR